MVLPVFGIRHLRPLASPSASTSRSISVPGSASASASVSSSVLKAATFVVSDAAATVVAPPPKASAIPHGHCHVEHSLYHGFSIRSFRHPPSPHRPLQARGKKTTTTIKLSDLPQGLIQLKAASPLPTSSSVSSPHDESTEALPLPLPPLTQDPPSYPTVLLQARQNMLKFDDCVLLTRVGGFYELYFEHAEEYGPLLNIKVANKKTNAGLVPMVCLLMPSFSSSGSISHHHHPSYRQVSPSSSSIVSSKFSFKISAAMSRSLRSIQTLPRQRSDQVG